jgi:hypothetical protein
MAEIDCRSDEGVTIGLIDAMISIARIAARRELTSAAVYEAIKDLRSDEDIAYLLSATLDS